MDSRFLILGGDKRLIYTANVISKHFETAAIGLPDFPAPKGKYDYIVLPLPFSRDGASINAPLADQPLPLSIISEFASDTATVFTGGSSAELAALCRNNKLWLADYFAREPLTLKNAFLTAEGAVSLLIQQCDFSLCGAEILITGYGRIGCYTARLLKAFGAEITVCCRSAEQRAKACLDGLCAVPISSISDKCRTARIIINTVPAQLFAEGDFFNMTKGTLFLELATRQDVPEVQFCQKHGVSHIMAKGLPGKISPETAGEAIAEVILTAVRK